MGGVVSSRVLPRGVPATPHPPREAAAAGRVYEVAQASAREPHTPSFDDLSISGGSHVAAPDTRVPGFSRGVVSFNVAADDNEIELVELMMFQPNDLVQLLYSSRSKQDFSPADLDELVKCASENNARLGITGALVYIDGTFVQALEGPHGKVTTLYDRILADERHDDMLLVRIRRIRAREFPDWGMKEAQFDSKLARDMALSSMLQAVQRGFSVLDKFAQPALSNLIRQGIDPVQIPARSSDVIIVCGAIRMHSRLNEAVHTLVAILNLFYSSASSIAVDYTGQVLKYNGEAVYVAFDAARSAQAQAFAQELARVTTVLCRTLHSSLEGARVAVSRGTAMRGNLGSAASRFDYSMLGQVVNEASRMAMVELPGPFLPTVCYVAYAPSFWALLEAAQVEIPAKVESVKLALKGRRHQMHLRLWEPTESEELMMTETQLLERYNLTLSSEKIAPADDSHIILRVTYVSRWAYPLSRSELKAIEEHAVRENERVGITGVLVLCNDVFLQIVEGEPQQVRDMMDRISRDRRHTRVTTVSVEPSDERRFEDWSMRVLGDQGADADAEGASAAFAVQVSYKMLETLAAAYRSVERYTPPKVLQLLREGRSPLEMAPTVRRVVVLCMDLVGFTTLSESFLTPQALLEHVNRALSIMLDQIAAGGGTVNNIVGDMVVATFPASKAHDALQTAVAVQTQFLLLRRTTPTVAGLARPEVLFCGCGMSYGPVLEANLGLEHLDLGIVGAPIQEAQAAEAATRRCEYNVLMTTSMSRLLNVLRPGKVKLVPGVDDYLALPATSAVVWSAQAANDIIKRFRDSAGSASLTGKSVYSLPPSDSASGLGSGVTNDDGPSILDPVALER